MSANSSILGADRHLLIAVDPGASGAVAACYAHAPTRPRVYKMPRAVSDVIALFAWRVASDFPEATRATALMEFVGHHRAGNASAGSSKFARHCGHLEAALIAAKMRTWSVAPHVWMAKFREAASINEWVTGPAGEAQRARKRILHDAARRLYPASRVTMYASDAMALLWLLAQSPESPPGVELSRRT